MTVKNQNGYTLLELLIVVTIFAVVSAIAIPYLADWRSSSQTKEIARGVLAGLRNARSLAIKENRSITATIDLDNHQLNFDTVQLDFNTNIKLEADDDVSTLASTGTKSVTFQPQGESSSALFVRVNEDPDLTIQLEVSGVTTL